MVKGSYNPVLAVGLVPALLADDLQSAREHLLLKIFMRKSALLLTLVVSVTIQAQNLKPIQLPTAQTEGGRPLMQVLKERKTRREFSPEKLPLQVLANLLWAGFGINRPTSAEMGQFETLS